MKFLIINNRDDLELIADYDIFFIDTKFEAEYFLRLLDELVARPIEVYKATNNIFSINSIAAERARIVRGDNELLEHYHKVDFFKHQLNKRLGIKRLKQDPVEKQLVEFRCKQREIFEANDSNKHLAYELLVPANPLLAKDVELFHQTLDTIHLAFTSDQTKYYSYQQELDKSDQLITNSNMNGTNQYFMLPLSKGYKQCKKLLYINATNYKQVLNSIDISDFIIDVSQELKHNQYIIKLFEENNIVTTNDYKLPQLNYTSQNRQRLIELTLVEEEDYLEVYEFIEGDLELVSFLEKNGYQYQKMILNYKNDIFYCN